MGNSIINIVTIIQARTASSRLPNKVLLPLANKNVLSKMVERVKSAHLAGTVVVATTILKEDDPVEDVCKKEKILYYRGHPTDLLDRHFKAGLKYNADVVIKIPSDCPLIDPKIIDRVIKYYLRYSDEFDYVSNLHPATYPDGNDVEIIAMNSLRFGWARARKYFEREHTTPFFWENPDRFRIGNVEWETKLDYSMTHRWTLDYEEDYQFISKVYDELYPANPRFDLYDILSLLKRKPEIAEINRKYLGVNWYRHHLNELKTITLNQTRI